MTKPLIIMHVDMDAFFAAVEQRDDPTLMGKPVIVGALPGKRGVVSTCSYEARKFGIHSAMPISEAYKRCPDGVYLKPDGTRYSAASKLVMAALAEISPIVEVVGIDEAYVDITGLERLHGDPATIGHLAKRKIYEATDLTASVGIGPNRMIAKIASDFEKPDGLTVVPPENVLAFLAPLEISALRGVGKVTTARLVSAGIHTVTELRERSFEELSSRFGEHYAQHLYNQARGIASDRVGGRDQRKSIGKETTFNENIDDPERLRQTLLRHAATVGRTARRESVRGRCITLKIRLGGFETHTRQRSIASPTDDDGVIFKTAWELYEKSKWVGRKVRLIGLSLSDWEERSQLDLFAASGASKDGGPNPKLSKLREAQDAIVDKFGRHALGVNHKPKSDWESEE